MKYLELVPVIVAVLANFALIVKMWIHVDTLVKWRVMVDNHISDTTRHLDPQRDDRQWADFIKRLDRLEKKMDDLIMMEKHKGVSND